MSIFQKPLFLKLGTCKSGMLITVSHCNPPSAYVPYTAVFNSHSMVSGNTCLLFIIRLKSCHINTAIVHMFVVNVSIYIMDHKILQNNFMKRTTVLCHYSHACSVHFVRCRVSLCHLRSCFTGSFSCHRLSVNIIFVCNLQIMDPDIFRIIEKDCRRNISPVYMCR